MSGEEDDKSLEDFFAKKDKTKKVKGKGKSKTSKEDGEKKKGKKDKNAESAQNANPEANRSDEWNDFQEPAEKDYSGLRIQSLQIVDDQKEKEDDAEQLSGSEDGESQSRKELSSGVWQVQQQAAMQQTAAVVPKEESQPTPPPARSTTGKYVPGAFRGGSAFTSMQTTTATKKPNRRPGKAPDIESETAFPTLGASAGIDKQPDKGRGDFELVKRGGTKSQGASMDNRPRLDLGNRYDSLRS